MVGVLGRKNSKWRDKQRKWEEEQRGYMKDLNELHRLNSDLHSQICELEVNLDASTRQVALGKQTNQELTDRIAIRDQELRLKDLQMKQ